ncbi:hypothetical protein HT585_09050 [Ensifer sp. HO-A22]|uniref:Uncharacterized protein n=1 Tax=Ensifer oleiphilus TaxID=2742698 RepID=A0A7Y6UMI5_9HYPH|nr:hypothetical protein [Ensifer oleiphilus]NVD38999.1 hypothetical protein [Ensifer oleiphilus]
MGAMIPARARLSIRRHGIKVREAAFVVFSLASPISLFAGSTTCQHAASWSIMAVALLFCDSDPIPKNDRDQAGGCGGIDRGPQAKRSDYGTHVAGYSTIHDDGKRLEIKRVDAAIVPKELGQSPAEPRQQPPRRWPLGVAPRFHLSELVQQPFLLFSAFVDIDGCCDEIAVWIISRRVSAR